MFTVDVEEYFHALALAEAAPQSRWTSLESRVEANTDILLELLARHDAVGTFFIVGWVADRHPGLVRRIVDGGHEVASHSYWHRRVTACSPEDFREDVRRAKVSLEQTAGKLVTGFRAPSFSIVPGTEWAFDLLLEEGYTWDSSLFPIRRPDYGYPESPIDPWVVRRTAGNLLEIPLATAQVFGMRLPAAGGAYLRQLPYALVHRALTQYAARGASAMFYVHPWEIDPGQPRLDVKPISRLRHYRNLDGMLARLDRLLGDFPFTSVERVLDVAALRVAT